MIVFIKVFVPPLPCANETRQLKFTDCNSDPGVPEEYSGSIRMGVHSPKASALPRSSWSCDLEALDPQPAALPGAGLPGWAARLAPVSEG